MSTKNQVELAEAFRTRHKQAPVLLLPNAWDPPSARLFEAAGFEAVATTSAGVAWALGYPDGEKAPWDEVVAATRRIVRVVRVPVTADIEAGFGATPEAVGSHVTEIIESGVVGINIEDEIPGTPMVRGIEEAVARVRAARAAADRAGIPIVINARTDLYHFPPAGDDNRYAATLERCRAYMEAGADCVYPFGLRDPETIGKLTAALGVPVNVTGRAGMPNADVLAKLGVARITIAAAPALVAMSTVNKIAEDLRSTGSFDSLASTLMYPDIQKLLS